MADTHKLTPTQKRALLWLTTEHQFPQNDSLKRACSKLVKMGLASRHRRLGFFDSYCLTDAGALRKTLEQGRA